MTANKFVNLTSHPVDIFSGGKVTTIYPSGKVLRVVKNYHPSEVVDGIPIYDVRLSFRPEPLEGVIYIVSKRAAAALNRADVVSPYRHIKRGGQIVGCKGLIRYTLKGEQQHA